MSVTKRPCSITPGYRIGRYEILARLAAGGMATVYVARSHGAGGFERLVAVKVLHEYLAYEEQFITMFFDEARLAARIRHPNVVATLDVNEAHGLYFLVMEYIEGDNLGQLLRVAQQRGERLPHALVLRIMTDALSGLAAAHGLCDERGRWLQLVHRDMSPHNIIVGRDGVARITDFGVAKATDRLTLTREGEVKGKLAYMAPEQASSAPIDARSDLFSVGVLLWEALTGQRLFDACHCGAILNQILWKPVPPPSAIDAALAPFDPVVARAVNRNPALRYASAEEFCAVLERLAQQECAGLSSRRALGNAVSALAYDKLERVRRTVAAVIQGKPLRHDALLYEQEEPVSRSFSHAAIDRDAATSPGRPAARRRTTPEALAEEEPSARGMAQGGSGPEEALPVELEVRQGAGAISGAPALDDALTAGGGRTSILLCGAVLASGIAAFFVMLWNPAVPGELQRPAAIDVVPLRSTAAGLSPASVQAASRVAASPARRAGAALHVDAGVDGVRSRRSGLAQQADGAP